ncbi:MAG: hypothetical protein WD766_04950 [Gemmatimonadota bacterium]
MSTRMLLRTLSLIFTLLAIAGGVRGAYASTDWHLTAPASAATSDAGQVPLPTSASLVESAQLSAALPAAGDISIRPQGKLPPVQIVTPHAQHGDCRGSVLHFVLRAAAISAAGSAHLHAGRLARSGSISSFATSLPPPSFA